MEKILKILSNELNRLFIVKSHVVIAIDGKCGAGKSTLARELEALYPANIIHMDDFYLPTTLRNGERLSEPGGNIHYERFLSQVLPAITQLQQDASTLDNTFATQSYQIFDCHIMDYKPENATIENRPLTIVEGSYCLRPEFRDAYDLKVFLDIDTEEQQKRLLARNGKEAYKNFESKWIPMELNYFKAYDVASCCDYVFTTDI